MIQVLGTTPRKTVEVSISDYDHERYDHRQFIISVTTAGEIESKNITAKVNRADIEKVGIYSIMHTLLDHVCMMIVGGNCIRIPKDKHGKVNLPFSVVEPGGGGMNALMLTITK